jgi:hypothetical protein
LQVYFFFGVFFAFFFGVLAFLGLAAAFFKGKENAKKKVNLQLVSSVQRLFSATKSPFKGYPIFSKRI